MVLVCEWVKGGKVYIKLINDLWINVFGKWF